MKLRAAVGRFLSAVFNRFTVTLAAILIQLAYFAVLFYRLYEYAAWVDMTFRVIAVLTAIYIIWIDFNPAYKIGWIVLIAALPAMGTVLFIIFGGKKSARSLRRKITAQEKLHEEEFLQKMDPDVIRSSRLRRTSEYVSKCAPYPAWDHTTIKYYPVSDLEFADMIEDMKAAKHFIFIEYFIITGGELWDEIFDVLKRKAAEGVDVRVLYDDIGSINKLPRRFQKTLREAGIRVLAFNTMKPLLSLVYNNRNHRKITVVDGYIGYNGGANIGDEYVNRRVRFGHWKDGSVRIRGEAVWNLTLMFLNMWNTFDPRDRDYDAFRPHAHYPGEFESEGVIQPFSDSPLDNEPVGESVYMELISQSRDYLYIYTPYLIPDSEMETQLKLAAKRGVDVRIVTQGIPDKKLIYAITRSYYKPLIAAGVKIYEYTPGFIHAKCFVCDDRAAVVGTINVDYRSFYLHFECGTLIMENDTAIRALKKDCFDTFARSRDLTENAPRKNIFGIVAGVLFRVFSPLL